MACNKDSIMVGLPKVFKKDEASRSQSDSSEKSHWGRIVVALVVLLVVLCVAIMIVNYRFPKFFTIEMTDGKPGMMFTRTLVRMSDNMTDRWLPNDMLWPTIFLDNPQNFQLGQLEAVRYSTRVLRDKLSRLRTTDKIDLDAEAAFVYFSNDPYKWILPSAESKFKSGVKSLKKYEARLTAGEAEFYPRADNLNELLDQYVSLLGGVTTRLSNAPRRKGLVLSEETAGDAYTKGEKYVEVEIPWSQIDDNFYYAQGVAFGLRQMMLAIKHDFENILDVKKATELVDRIVHILDQSQFEPLIVLNGDRGSVFANHSLQLQGLLEDARQKMRSLQDMIQQ
jgi:hypothetical protein